MTISIDAKLLTSTEQLQTIITKWNSRRMIMGNTQGGPKTIAFKFSSAAHTVSYGLSALKLLGHNCPHMKQVNKRSTATTQEFISVVFICNVCLKSLVALFCL